MGWRPSPQRPSTERALSTVDMVSFERHHLRNRRIVCGVDDAAEERTADVAFRWGGRLGFSGVRV